jgi:enhancing lycopene biosynthesis protein 2
MKKVAVILSGCGARDGTEIREAISLLLSLSQLNVKYNCFSVDKPQAIVFDHYHNKISEGETRNTLVESARIARGRVQDLKTLNLDDFDGIAFAGGYGAGLNLSNFASLNSTDFNLEPDVENIIKAFKNAKKPMYFLCISPVLVAKVLKDVKITLGGESEVSQQISTLGTEIEIQTKNEPTFDERNKIITTPCYMLEISLAELYDGIFKGAKIFASIL